MNTSEAAGNWLTHQEAADYLKIHRVTLRRLVKSQLIRRARLVPGAKRGAVRYSREELDSYLEGRLRRER